MSTAEVLAHRGQQCGDSGKYISRTLLPYDYTVPYPQAPIPKNCTFNLEQDIEGLNKFLMKVREEVSYIQPVHSMKYLTDEKGGKQILIMQPFHKEGSLTDLIHKEVSTTSSLS